MSSSNIMSVLMSPLARQLTVYRAKASQARRAAIAEANPFLYYLMTKLADDWEEVAREVEARSTAAPLALAR